MYEKLSRTFSRVFSELLLGIGQCWHNTLLDGLGARLNCTLILPNNYLKEESPGKLTSGTIQLKSLARRDMRRLCSTDKFPVVSSLLIDVGLLSKPISSSRPDALIAGSSMGSFSMLPGDSVRGGTFRRRMEYGRCARSRSRSRSADAGGASIWSVGGGGRMGDRVPRFCCCCCCCHSPSRGTGGGGRLRGGDGGGGGGSGIPVPSPPDWETPDALLLEPSSLSSSWSSCPPPTGRSGEGGGGGMELMMGREARVSLCESRSWSWSRSAWPVENMIKLSQVIDVETLTPGDTIASTGVE